MTFITEIVAISLGILFAEVVKALAKQTWDRLPPGEDGWHLSRNFVTDVVKRHLSERRSRDRRIGRRFIPR